MTHYKLLVMTQPKPGREAEYDKWYDEVHLVEMCQVPGFKSAQRFRLRPTPKAEAGGVEYVSPGLDYLAIYEVETDDLDALLRTLGERLASMTLSDSTVPRVMSEFFAPRNTW